MHRNKDSKRAPVWVNVYACRGRCMASAPYDDRFGAAKAADYVAGRSPYKLNSRVKVTFK